VHGMDSGPAKLPSPQMMFPPRKGVSFWRKINVPPPLFKRKKTTHKRTTTTPITNPIMPPPPWEGDIFGHLIMYRGSIIWGSQAGG